MNSLVKSSAVMNDPSSSGFPPILCCHDCMVRLSRPTPHRSEWVVRGAGVLHYARAFAANPLLSPMTKFSNT